MDNGLDYYKNIQYDVVVRKKGDRYLVFIPELSLAEEDTTLDQAYEKLEREKEDYFRKIIAWGYEDYIKTPEAAKEEKAKNDFAPFFIKFAIVLVSILFITVISGLTLIHTAPSAIKNKAKILIERPEKLLIRFNEMMENKSDDQKEETKKHLRETVKHIKPYMNELHGLFDNMNDEDGLTVSGKPNKQ